MTVVGRTKLTTLVTVKVPRQNIYESRIWDKVSRIWDKVLEKYAYFGATQIYLKHKLRVASMPKNQLDTFNHFPEKQIYERQQYTGL